jgi:WD40 repeat protein
MFDVVLEDFKGKLLKIFPVTVGWHVISNSQLIHITAEDENQRLAITYPFEMKIIDVIESKNGYYLLGAEQIYNFDIETKEVAVVDLPIGVHPTAFNASDDLKELAVGYASGTIDLFDLNSKSLIGQLGDHTSRVTTILFSSNREHLVSAGLDRVVNIWNMAELKKEPIQFGDHDSFITALHYNDSTNLLMVGEVNGTLKYYNLNNDLQIQQLCNEEPGSLSREEWNRYIGNHIKYDPYSCNSTSLNTGLYYEAK